MTGPQTYASLRVAHVPALPVSQMVIGKPVEEAAELLPRVFNLCRVAQGLAARAAFGLPLPMGWQTKLRQEILREHVVKLCLKWPTLLSLRPLDLPKNWMAQPTELRRALFGTLVSLPDTSAAFEVFLASDQGIAPVLNAVRHMFRGAMCTRSKLPTATIQTVFDGCAQENSVAARRHDHPVMNAIETTHGRGPLWSATAVAYDVEAMLNGHLPEASLSPSCAVVPAARGFYGVTAQVDNGCVTSFARVTPTDHMLAKGGILEQSLATLPAESAPAVAQCLISILDPCYPIRLEHATEREQAYA